MTAICDDVYAERGLDSAQVSELRSAREEASQNIARAFVTVRSSPLILFCHSAACKIELGAPPRAAVAQDLGFASAHVLLDDGAVAPSAVVVTGPVPRTAPILTHELVHAEMKTRVAYDMLPTWFNEGTATFIAGEPSCTAHPSPPQDLDVSQLATKARWEQHLRASGRTLETYCAAQHEVAKWMAQFETEPQRAQALETLLTSVAGGTPFERAFVRTR